MTDDEPNPPAEHESDPRPKLTDRETLADIQADLRKETSDRAKWQFRRGRQV